MDWIFIGITGVYYITLHYDLLCPDPRKGAISVAFVRPSVAYIANNSRTQRPSVHTFGRKVPHLRCDSRTSFKVKWSKVRVRGGRGHTEPGGHTACLQWPKLHSKSVFPINLDWDSDVGRNAPIIIINVTDRCVLPLLYKLRFVSF